MKIAFKPDILTPASPTICAFLNSWAHGHRQIVVSGPRNTSKSLHILGYWLWLHENVPNFRSLIVRSEMKTIRNTIVPTLNDKLLRYPLADDRNPFKVYGGTKLDEIVFDNGGRCVFGGMDNSEKVLGGSYDFIFYNQAERERNEGHWADLLGCMAGGRNAEWYVNGKPFYQIIGDCNPTDPGHFLYQRKDSDALQWYDFKHQDHPLFYDWGRGEFTERGLETIRDLEDAYPPGHLRDRMVYGEWTAASGLVYPLYDAKTQVKVYNRSDFPDDDWEWCRSIDYGWNDPNVCDLWALRKDREKAVLFKEIYRSETTIEEFGRMINEMCDSYGILDFNFTVTDHKPEYNEELGKMGIWTVNADKSVLRNINLVRDAFSEDKLRFNSDMLYHAPDRILLGKSLPTSFLDEITRYRYKDVEDQRGDGTADLPLKSCADHSMNCLEYFAQKVWGTKDRPYLAPLVHH